MPSLAVPHAPVQNANPAPGEKKNMVNKVQVSPMACSFFNKNDWQISTAGSFIKKNLANRVNKQTKKVWDLWTSQLLHLYSQGSFVRNPEKGACLTILLGSKKLTELLSMISSSLARRKAFEVIFIQTEKNAPRWATTIFINGIMGLQKKRPYKWLSLKAFHFSAYRSAGKKRPPSPGEIFTWFSNASRHRCRSGRSTSRLGLAISSHMEWWRTSLEYEICT